MIVLGAYSKIRQYFTEKKSQVLAIELCYQCCIGHGPSLTVGKLFFLEEEAKPCERKVEEFLIKD